MKHYSLQDNEFAKVVANYILDEANKSILASGVFTLVLSGGNTPILIFKELVKKQKEVDWRKIEIYWVDERCVPVNSVESNYGNCKKYLIDKIENEPKVYPMYFSGSPQNAAKKYQQLLEINFKNKKKPEFDLILLGVGSDGHVASIFPETDELNEVAKWVIETNSPFFPKDRISLTFPVINSTKKILIIAKGNEKKWVYDACAKTTVDLSVPACNINPDEGDIIWFVSF